MIQKREGKTKMNIPMFFGCILLCLTLISIHMTSGLYAKYVTKASSSDFARVAKFDVIVEDGNESNEYTFDSLIELAPGMPEASDKDTLFMITVTNESEVAVDCSFTAENVSGNIPLKLSFYENESLSVALDDVQAVLAPNEKKIVYFQTSWPLYDSNGKLFSSSYSFEIDLLRIHVVSTQID